MEAPFIKLSSIWSLYMPRPRRRKRVLWTSKELNTLKKLAGRQGVRRIAKQLGRSEAAVRFKAWQKRIKLAVRRP